MIETIARQGRDRYGPSAIADFIELVRSPIEQELAGLTTAFEANYAQFGVFAAYNQGHRLLRKLNVGRAGPSL